MAAGLHLTNDLHFDEGGEKRRRFLKEMRCYCAATTGRLVNRRAVMEVKFHFLVANSVRALPLTCSHTGRQKWRIAH